MRAERIRVHSAPTRIGPAWPFVTRTDTVAPLILIGKTSTRPAQHWNMQFFQRVDHVVAQAVRVWNGRVLSHPETVVNQASEVFGKLAVEVPVDDPARLVHPHRERGFVRFSRLSRCGGGGQGQNQQTYNQFSVHRYMKAE